MCCGAPGDVRWWWHRGGSFPLATASLGVMQYDCAGMISASNDAFGMQHP